MKIATKLTKKVAEFVNEQYIRNFHPDESDYLHFDSEIKPTPCMFSELLKGYTSVSEQEFIDMVTAELAGTDREFEIGDSVVVKDDYLQVYDLMNYSGVPVKIIDPTIKTQRGKYNVDIPHNSLGGLNVPAHKLTLAIQEMKTKCIVLGQENEPKPIVLKEIVTHQFTTIKCNLNPSYFKELIFDTRIEKFKGMDLIVGVSDVERVLLLGHWNDGVV